MTKLAKEALLKPEQLAKLKELFPQAFVDGKVDFVILKALLGEQVEETNEKYQFTWNGKKNAIAHAQKPSLGTLREDKASSKDFDSTENLYIEGDNLEVLKLLQKTYQGKIKMIYIDPPYNTGNDFVYKDDFKDNVKNYLELTNQNNKSNAETSGRYHTDWLNMMYPRLMLARNLLTDDGVIFISIDDNEQSNLKKICDEIFGEMNFINTFIWVNNLKGRQISNSGAAKTYEYIMVYSKEIQKIETFEISNSFASREMPMVYNEFKYKIQSDEIGKYVIKNELFNTNSI
jgi:adenine-specific DNA-methyltransferase